MLNRSKTAAKITRRGFTLLELIIVLLILGVLAAIAIPTFNRIQENSVERALLTSAESVVRNANSIAASERNLGGDVDSATLWTATAEAYGFDEATENDQDWTSANGDQAAVIESNGANSAATGLPVSVTLTEESGNICKTLSVEIDPAAANDGSRVYVEVDANGEKVVSDC